MGSKFRRVDAKGKQKSQKAKRSLLLGKWVVEAAESKAGTFVSSRVCLFAAAAAAADMAHHAGRQPFSDVPTQ